MSNPQWHRIEPHARSDRLDEGLQARIADPLWMLARQWQVGEFRGEDAASPVHARLVVRSHRIQTLRNDAVATGSPTVALPPQLPLEPRVEAEQVIDGPARLRLAADAGAQFLRRLEAVGMGSLREKVRETCPLDVTEDDLAGLPEREVRRLRLMARRAVDGRKVASSTPSALLSADRAGEWASKLDRVFDAWRPEYESRFVGPMAAADSWVDERMEYRFSIAAATDEGEVVLDAPEYIGGHLDWYSFDVVDTAPTHGLTPDKGDVGSIQLLPVPLGYPGMPATRWWEFEDGSVYHGGISAGPADLGRLVLAEFATVYSDDWFIVPVRLPTGSLSRIQRLDVIDTFGEVHHIRSTAANDQEDVGKTAVRPWSFFELAGDGSAVDGDSPWLLLPQTLATSLEGRPLEQVSLVRDEAANLVWGIEERIEMPTGRSLRRRQQWTTETRDDGSGSEHDTGEPDPDRGEAEQVVGASTDPPWDYRLQVPVPPNWIPFMPELHGAGPDVRLRRARMQVWQEMDQSIVGARGRILDPGGPLRLYEEEVPRGGLEVTRAWQFARGADGRTYLWSARRKRPGRGERGSGLGFDRMLREGT